MISQDVELCIISYRDMDNTFSVHRCEEEGDIDKANECYQSAVDINPEMEEAKKNLARLKSVRNVVSSKLRLVQYFFRQVLMAIGVATPNCSFTVPSCLCLRHMNHMNTAVFSLQVRQHTSCCGYLKQQSFLPMGCHCQIFLVVK